MEGPTSKTTTEPHKKVNHKANIKCPNPLLSKEAYQIRKGDSNPQGKHQVPQPPPLPISISNKERGGPPERMPNLEEPSPTTTTARLILL
jgi:hypothetical protein